MLKKIIKEPLVHFMLLGFFIFGFYYWIEKDQENQGKIVIDESEYNYLLSSWKNQWQREPSEEDIRAFVDQYLRQEVFYKEALNMGLDHNDLIIKRRLAQKMEAVSNDLSEMVTPPTEAALRDFYQENLDLFQLPKAYSFQQVLIPEQDSKSQESIELLREQLISTDQIPDAYLRKLSLANDFEKLSQQEIDNTFGGDFGTTLDKLEVKKWVGPVHSGFGMHLVYISEVQEARVADFENARPYIQKEFEYRSEVETQERFYRELLKKYDIEISSESIPTSIKDSYQSL